MIVILDNARWHHAQQIKPWLKEHHNVIRLDFLPPYSPNLNPIERVWKLIRRLCTHNRYFPNINNLINTVFNQFKRWQQPNETLRRLCALLKTLCIVAVQAEKLWLLLIMKVSDFMLSGKNNPVVELSSTVKEMILKISEKQAGAVSVVDENGKLVGLITDYDIRK